VEVFKYVMEQNKFRVIDDFKNQTIYETDYLSKSEETN